MVWKKKSGVIRKLGIRVSQCGVLKTLLYQEKNQFLKFEFFVFQKRIFHQGVFMSQEEKWFGKEKNPFDLKNHQNKWCSDRAKKEIIFACTNLHNFILQNSLHHHFDNCFVTVGTIFLMCHSSLSLKMLEMLKTYFWLRMFLNRKTKIKRTSLVKHSGTMIQNKKIVWVKIKHFFLFWNHFLLRFYFNRFFSDWNHLHKADLAGLIEVKWTSLYF